MRHRTYSELRRLETIEERYRYLKLDGVVGQDTFGYDRWMNQAFYGSWEWRNIRQHVIARDLGCDLGVPDHEIHDKVYVHHMNPINVDALIHGDSDIVDPEFLISVTFKTHNAIHYGDESQLRTKFVERKPGDTTLWKN